MLGICHFLDSGIALHELVENGHGDGAAGFVEEDDGDEEAEGVAGETFLDEAERGGGERGEGDAGDVFLGRGFGWGDGGGGGEGEVG